MSAVDASKLPAQRRSRVQVDAQVQAAVWSIPDRKILRFSTSDRFTICGDRDA